MNLSRATLVAIVGVIAIAAVGCPCTDSIVNSSPSLRWKLFASYGAQRVCEEMTKRGAPVQAAVPVPGFSPASGRFYPQSCQSELNDDQHTLKLWITGNGYAWTPGTQKMSFECSMSVEYRPDFHKDGDTIYVWFDVVRTEDPRFKIVHVEQLATNIALKLYPVEWFASALARSFLQAQLAKGFTVIQEERSQDFSFGRLEVGQRPVHPWDVHGANRYTLMNETSELRGQQQDFLGPFEIESDKRALFLKMQVSGPSLDVFLVPRDVGYAWRMRYQTTSPAPAPPQGAIILQQAQTQPNGLFDAWVPVQRGLYYIVVDNSSQAGVMRPATKLPTPTDPSLSQAAVINYLVQVGDTP